jgi:hypothetical protein
MRHRKSPSQARRTFLSHDYGIPSGQTYRAPMHAHVAARTIPRDPHLTRKGTKPLQEQDNPLTSS